MWVKTDSAGWRDFWDGFRKKNPVQDVSPKIEEGFYVYSRHGRLLAKTSDYGSYNLYLWQDSGWTDISIEEAISSATYDSGSCHILSFRAIAAGLGSWVEQGGRADVRLRLRFVDAKGIFEAQRYVEEPKPTIEHLRARVLQDVGLAEILFSVCGKNHEVTVPIDRAGLGRHVVTPL